MTFTQLQKKAKDMGVKAIGVKKIELIRSIQKTEGNTPCFATGLTKCEQYKCCWRRECLSE
jgi:hypothetical protein